jgi:hypothetical protein
VADSIAALTTGAFPSWIGVSAPWSTRIPSAVAALLLAAWGALGLRRDRAVRIAALSALGFLLLCLAYSAALQPIFIPGRTDAALLVPLLFLISLQVDLSPWRRARTALVAVWGLVCLALVLTQLGQAPRSAAAPVWKALAERVQPGDVVVSAGLAAGQASYVHHRSRTGSVFEFFPASAGRHVGYTSFRALRQQRKALGEEAQASASRWAAALGGSGRLWLVWSGDPEFEPLESAIRGRFRLEQVAARGALPLIGDPVELRAYRAE